MAARPDAAVATDTEILLAELCSLIAFLISFLRANISQGVPPVCQLTKYVVFSPEMKELFCVRENVSVLGLLETCNKVSNEERDSSSLGVVN